MPRNGSGTSTVVNTFVIDTIADPDEVNANFTDVADQLTNSLPRDGQAGMNAPLPLQNGTASLPALTFTSDPDTGIYRAGTNKIGLALGGVGYPLDAGVVYAEKAGNYTAVAGDNNAVHRFTADATLTLDPAATLGVNWHYTFIADANVTIDPDASETINGATTLVIYNGQTAFIICTGTAFFAYTINAKASTQQIFTASGTYTAPAGLVRARVCCIGGGGGGGYARSGVGSSGAGAGGGAGGYSESILTAATIGASQTVTIGAGGTKGTGATPVAAGNGGDTSFGSLVVAKGGLAGTGGNATSGINIADAGAGGDAASGTGTLTASGQPGSPGIVISGGGGASSSHVPGNGGNSVLSGGGLGAAVSIGFDGKYGSGGSGAGAQGGGNRDGGDGGAGIIIVDEFYS